MLSDTHKNRIKQQSLVTKKYCLMNVDMLMTKINHVY